MVLLALMGVLGDKLPETPSSSSPGPATQRAERLRRLESTNNGRACLKEARRQAPGVADHVIAIAESCVTLMHLQERERGPR
jgi:hypothetical protein